MTFTRSVSIRSTRVRYVEAAFACLLELASTVSSNALTKTSRDIQYRRNNLGSMDKIDMLKWNSPINRIDMTLIGFPKRQAFVYAKYMA